MLRFHADGFVEAVHTYTNAKAAIQSGKLGTSEAALIESGVKLPASVKAGAEGAVRQLYDIMSDHRLMFARAACGRTLNVLKADPLLADKSLCFLLDDIYVRMKDELASRVFVSIDAAQVDLFEPSGPLFGAEVDVAFPSTAYDIAEAGKCIALDRATASVMHLMRAMESPMQLMATDLGVSTTRANWGKMLPGMETAIAALPNSDQDRRTVYSEVALQFRFMKNAWRDHAMHARGKYTETEAKEIFEACRSIAQKLAKRLKE